MSRTITFYKLISPYTEDITKNCSLFGNEIDDNFMNLKELSIDSVELSGTTIIIKRIGDEQLTVDLSEIIPDEPTMSVSYDEELGKIQIDFNEETFIIDGLLNQVNSTKLFLKKVAADLTLTGNGTIQNPLTINLTHKTGMYEPAIEYLDLTSGDTLPTSGMSIGDSYITKEIRNSFGYLYNLEGVNEIKQALLAENSEWRVPTKEDWDVMLNALECDGFKNHNNTEVSIILGKDAGKILKSREYWQESNETNAGNDTYLFSSMPSGYGDDAKLITHAYEWGEYWTDTESSDFEHYTKQFRFDETGVYQLSRNINDYFSLRLVKTYNGENFVEYEKINNAIVKTDLMPSDSGDTRLVWTMENLNFGEDNYGGLRTPLLDEITETDLFYNVWNGNIWLKRKMKEGETTVILSDSGDTIYNICMVVNHELINTNLDVIAISGQVLTNIEDIEYLETNKANVSDLLSVSGQVSGNTEDISNLYTNKADKATTLSGYGITDAYTKTESDDKYETIENVDLLRNIVTGNTEDISDLTSNKADKATTLSGYGITDAYTKTESDGKYETIENVDLLEGIVSGNIEDISNLQSDKADKATTLSGYGITDAYTKTESDDKYETIENVDLLKGIVSGYTTSISNLQSDKADKATTLAGYGITDAYTKTESDDKYETIENVDLLRNIVSGNTEDISDLTSNKADKATTLAGYGITDAYTKTESDGKYETIENVDLLRNIVSGHTEDILDLQTKKADKATTLSGYGITDAYTQTEIDTKLDNIEHDNTLNKNSNTDFLHINEEEKTNFVNASDFVEDFVSNATNILHADLLTLIDNNELIPSSSYRITNYTTTTVQGNTTSAGHNFDVIVIALSTNELSENAKCVRKSGDTYFANAKLEAWEIKYCINNDISRFAWTDSVNGKGVIYYMKDENGNECPYDFKNIQFKKSNVFLYTFGGTTDNSLTGGCHHNIMMDYMEDSILTLNFNTFGEDCSSNTFGKNFSRNTFGNDCYSNTFGGGCHSNTFGNGCNSNTFENGCWSNTFGYYCQSNTFGDGCYSNTFGNNCDSNTFGDSCDYNTFGNNCNYNTFGNNCQSNNFYHGSSGATKKNYIRYIVLEDGVSYNNFYSDLTTDNGSYLQRIRIKGLSGTSTTQLATTISLTATNTKYEWVICYKSDETLKQYCPND